MSRSALKSVNTWDHDNYQISHRVSVGSKQAGAAIVNGAKQAGAAIKQFDESIRFSESAVGLGRHISASAKVFTCRALVTMLLDS